jgi:putative aldouronate transport system permease protein
MLKSSDIPQYKRAKGISAKIGTTIINVLLIAAGIMCILPVLHLLAVSLSANGPANANAVGLIPVGFNLNSYKEVFTDEKMLNALGQSVKRVAIGVPVNMILTLLCAYPLSIDKKAFPLRGVYAAIIIFTMLFSGGLIPSYILINRLGLMNNIWSLILPGIPIFNVIIMMNFFRQIPEELKEAAFIDGAGHFVILLKILIPLSGAVFATLLLFSFVGHWNSWFDALIYMKDMHKYPLQSYIQTLVSRMTTSPDLEEAKRLAFLSRRSLLFARIFVSITPILLIYPFLQKYYRTGLVIGAVKG